MYVKGELGVCVKATPVAHELSPLFDWLSCFCFYIDPRSEPLALCPFCVVLLCYTWYSRVMFLLCVFPGRYKDASLTSMGSSLKLLLVAEGKAHVCECRSVVGRVLAADCELFFVVTLMLVVVLFS